MTNRLTLKQEKEKWYPASIANLEVHLAMLFITNSHFQSEDIYPIKKNISYSLQYIEFLNQVLKDLSLSEVLRTQNIKSFVVHGASVIEAIFNYLVISEGYGNSTQWKPINKHRSPEYELKAVKYISEIEVFEKLEMPIPSQMTFDQLAKKVEKKKLLGESFNDYSKIKPIRQLRNKIHIHDSEHSYDTDWNNFNQREFDLMSDVLYKVLVSEIFEGSRYLKVFDYLSIANNKIQLTANASAD